VEQQDRQQGPLLQAADVNGMPVDRYFERPEKAIVDHFPQLPSTVKHAKAPADSADSEAASSHVSFL
jgi:hypothetical protein